MGHHFTGDETCVHHWLLAMNEGIKRRTLYTHSNQCTEISSPATRCTVQHQGPRSGATGIHKVPVAVSRAKLILVVSGQHYTVSLARLCQANRKKMPKDTEADVSSSQRSGCPCSSSVAGCVGWLQHTHPVPHGPLARSDCCLS